MTAKVFRRIVLVECIVIPPLLFAGLSRPFGELYRNIEMLPIVLFVQIVLILFGLWIIYVIEKEIFNESTN